jgi:hypothetical protein
MMGPKRGPKDQIDIACPRFSRGTRSAIVPLPHVIAATPATPSRNRKKINDAIPGASALAILNITNKTLQTLYTHVRPLNSLNGAIIKGPKANPRTYTETTKAERRFDVVPNSFKTCVIPGANIEEARGLARSVIRLNER